MSEFISVKVNDQKIGFWPNCCNNDIKTMSIGLHEYIENTNCTLDKLDTRFDMLRKFINILTTDVDFFKTVIDNCPTNKDGTLTKNSIVLYRSNISYWDGFVAKEIVVRLKKHGYYATTLISNIRGPLVTFYHADEIQKTDEGLGFTHEIVVELIPKNNINEVVVDSDFKIKKVENKKASYIPVKDLIPGTSYLDKKGNEYLYLSTIISHPDTYSVSHKYIFLKLNKKLKDQLIVCSSFKDWFKDFCQDKLDKDQEVMFSFKDNIAFRVTEKVDEYFKPEELNCTVTCKWTYCDENDISFMVKGNKLDIKYAVMQCDDIIKIFDKKSDAAKFSKTIEYSTVNSIAVEI